MSTSDLSGDCFCGIDIAKRNHQALILDAHGKVVKPAFLVTNNRAGFDRLREELQQISGTLIVALEATGFSDVFLTSSRRLLAQAVTAQEFADFELSELSHLLQQSRRGRWDATQAQSKAQTLHNTARQSVGVPFLADAARLQVRSLLQQLDLLQTQREAVEASMEALMDQIPQHLITIDGIGQFTGAAILAEIGEVKRFPTLEALVAYAGIDATVHQSGEFVARETHISKRGSPYLRRALWQAATSLLTTHGDLAAYYHKKRAQGKAHGTALGVLCRKLLARVYVVLKENRAYEPR